MPQPSLSGIGSKDPKQDPGSFLNAIKVSSLPAGDTALGFLPSEAEFPQNPMSLPQILQNGRIVYHALLGFPRLQDTELRRLFPPLRIGSWANTCQPLSHATQGEFLIFEPTRQEGGPGEHRTSSRE